MTAAESLAMLIASGVQAEAVVRATVDSLDKDWQEATAMAHNHAGTDAGYIAVAKMEALAPYRALLGAVVATWDGPDEGTTEVVRIGGTS